MIGWVALGIYVVGYVLSARKLSVVFLNDSELGGDGDPFDQVMSRGLGVLAALAWPAILLGALITGKLPKTDGQLRADLAARDARIAELEREAGIR